MSKLSLLLPETIAASLSPPLIALALMPRFRPPSSGGPRVTLVTISSQDRLNVAYEVNRRRSCFRVLREGNAAEQSKADCHEHRLPAGATIKRKRQRKDLHDYSLTGKRRWETKQHHYSAYSSNVKSVAMSRSTSGTLSRKQLPSLSIFGRGQRPAFNAVVILDVSI